jgi:hypothetical protein
LLTFFSLYDSNLICNVKIICFVLSLYYLLVVPLSLFGISVVLLLS